MKIEFGSMFSADLKENKIILDMEDPVSISAGNYAVIKLESLNDRIALEEFIESKK